MPKWRDSYPIERNAMYTPEDIVGSSGEQHDRSKRGHVLYRMYDPFERGTHNEDFFPAPLWERHGVLGELTERVNGISVENA